MPNRTTNDKHYDCKTCVNRNSPLCELCTQITSPSGKEHKPKYYIGQSDITVFGGRGGSYQRITADKETERLAKYLLDHLLARAPLPTSVVLEYNRKAEKEE